MYSYIVTLNDANNEIHNTILQGRDELANLVMHLDDKRFKIISVQGVFGFNDNYKDFCEKDDNLEKGDETHD